MRLLALVVLSVTVVSACRSGPTAPGVERDVFVIRHAEAWSNVPEGQRGGRSGDAADALTPKGMQQAADVAEQLVGSGVSVVFHSPRGRTRETAEVVARRLGAQLVELEALRPMADGESVEAAAARVLAGLAERDEPGDWAIVSHSGSTAALLGEADGMPPEARLRNKLKTGGMRQLRWRADGSWAAR